MPYFYKLHCCLYVYFGAINQYWKLPHTYALHCTVVLVLLACFLELFQVSENPVMVLLDVGCPPVS